MIFLALLILFGIFGGTALATLIVLLACPITRRIGTGALGLLALVGVFFIALKSEHQREAQRVAAEARNRAAAHQEMVAQRMAVERKLRSIERDYGYASERKEALAAHRTFRVSHEEPAAAAGEAAVEDSDSSDHDAPTPSRSWRVTAFPILVLVVLFVMLASVRSRKAVLATIAAMAVVAVLFAAPMLYLGMEGPEIAQPIRSGADTVYSDPAAPHLATVTPPAKSKEAVSEEVENDEGATTPADEVETSSEDSSSSDDTNAKPWWVGVGMKRAGDIAYVEAVTDRLTSREECEVQMDQVLEYRADQIVDRLLGVGAAQKVDLSREYIWDNLVSPDEQYFYSENPDGRFTRCQLHRLMVIGPEDRDYIEEEYEAAVRREKLAATGGGVLAVLLVLGTVFGYLQLDTATKGFYTRRLQVVAGSLILAILGGVLVLMT